MRGGVVTMNFYDPDGHLLDYRRIEELAGAQRISLRTGCFCNPGTGETAEHITEDDILAALDQSHDMSLPRFLQFITHRGGKSAGAIRVSVGIASNFADVQRFVEFAASMRDQTRLSIGETSASTSPRAASSATASLESPRGTARRRCYREPMHGGDDMNPATSRAKLTYDDFLLFPDDGQRHELIDGEHYVTPSPNTKHQQVSGNLYFLMRRWLETHPVGQIFFAPFDVVFTRFDVVEPDLLYLSNARAHGRL